MGHIVKPLTPLLRILGLDKKIGMLWLTAVIFGLLYGAAVIVEEASRQIKVFNISVTIFI